MQQAEQRLRIIKQLLIWQLLGAFLVGLFALLWGSVAGLGAFLGGLIAWLPNCYFAFRAFKYRGARAARMIVRSFYAGAAGKMLLTAGLFTLVFVNLRPLNAPAVFIGFATVQAFNWVVPLVYAKLDARKL